MNLTNIAGLAVGRIAGRLARRAAGWLVVVIFMLAAIYQATTAASSWLELEFGVVQAHLIIAAFYVVAALVVVAILWATSRRPSPTVSQHVGALHSQPEVQLASIVEAMLLGYSLSRRK
jgi:hypothetical protein